MWQLEARALARKFGRQWVFSNFSAALHEGGLYAITGNNGSGKTTLLKVLSAAMPATKGELVFKWNNKILPAEAVFAHLSWVGPYTGIPEELSLEELFGFTKSFKKLSLTYTAFEELLGYRKYRHLPVAEFSSGMRQKTKLALAMYSASKLLLLDEPTATLDAQNTAWYHEQLAKVREGKLILLASNQESEYPEPTKVFTMASFKKSIQKRNSRV
jgi:ABC-type multidrug transport system ATPase subunit